MGMSDDKVLRKGIDTQYAVHEGTIGQTGGYISMGHGTVLDKSLKQKLNGKSSTETEVIGMSDMLPFNIWLNNSMITQENGFKENILFKITKV